MLHSETFDTTPKIRNTRLNVLPKNSDKGCSSNVVGLGRFPKWLHRNLPKGNEIFHTGQIVASNRLHTVCEEAKCPNLLECWSKGTATFLIMGKECTRSCGFCEIAFSKKPKELDADEPKRVAESVKQLNLKHVVITMVARDDLSDGGAAHLSKVVEAIRKESSNTTIELLTSDFLGNKDAWDIALSSKPEIFNYNIETVRELSPRVRHKATYERTLAFLKYIKNNKQNPLRVKSGLMVGLGETEVQVFQTIQDLYSSGCDIITIGQYLQPSRQKLLVKDFIHPDQFKKYENHGLSIGVPYMYCGPFVRSSYNAGVVIQGKQIYSE